MGDPPPEYSHPNAVNTYPPHPVQPPPPQANYPPAHPVHDKYPPGHAHSYPGYGHPHSGYPAPPPPYAHQPVGYAHPPQAAPQSTTNVVVVGGTDRTPQTQTIIKEREPPRVNHVLHLIISFFFFPWVVVWFILCVMEGQAF